MYNTKNDNASEILFLKPVMKETVWGGSRLSEDFGYDIPSPNTGECWAISAHPHGDCVVQNGQYAETPLSVLWREHRELFGNIPNDSFPLLIKIIDAADDLSIQVHPDDEYAEKHEGGALGKTECWYILDCAADATIILGHRAKDRKQLKQLISSGNWNELSREVPIHSGDLLQIEPGVLHAIKAGTLLLEIQQNSDITYRLYDYGRLSDGMPRELHTEKGLAVLKAPYEQPVHSSHTRVLQGGIITKLVSCKHYTVEKIETDKYMVLLQSHSFLCCSVIDGNGSINGKTIKKGDHFIVPFGFGNMTLCGNLTIITSYV